MSNNNTENNLESTEFLPKNETARIAVERARQIVKDNHEMIVKLKEDSNILTDSQDSDAFFEASQFSHQDSHSFDLTKIRSTNGITDFFKDIFGVF